MSPEIKVIQPSGTLDSINGNHLRRQIIDAVETGAKTILIDCKDVEFMDSSGLSTLVMALKIVRDVRGQMFLCSINDQLRMLLEITSMDDVFTILPSREEFNQAMLAAH